MKLQNFKNDDGLELVIDLETGAVYASISAVARMTDKSDSTINRYVNGKFDTSAAMTLLTAGIVTSTGLKTSALLDENQIFEVFSKYKPDLLLACAKAGLRLFLHRECGFKYRTSAESEPRRLPPIRDAKENLETSQGIEQVNNETLKQLLRNQLIDELSVSQRKVENFGTKSEHTIVKVRAKELGFSTQEIGSGSALGRFVAKKIPVAFTERVGKFVVKHYEINQELDDRIKEFFRLRLI